MITRKMKEAGYTTESRICKNCAWLNDQPGVNKCRKFDSKVMLAATCDSFAKRASGLESQPQ